MSYTQRIRSHVEAELNASHTAVEAGDFVTAYRHLERAHILGQPSTRLHVVVHWRFFVLALRQAHLLDVIGQGFRLIGAALFTAVGLVPHGNTGGTDVSAFKRMPIPEELQRIIDSE